MQQENIQPHPVPSHTGVKLTCWAMLLLILSLSLLYFSQALMNEMHSLMLTLAFDSLLGILILLLKRAYELNDRRQTILAHFAFLFYLWAAACLLVPYFSANVQQHAMHETNLPSSTITIGPTVTAFTIVFLLWFSTYFIIHPFWEHEIGSLPQKITLSVEYILNQKQRLEDLTKSYDELAQENEKQTQRIQALQLVQTPLKEIEKLIQQKRCVLCKTGTITNAKHNVCRSCAMTYSNIIGRINAQRYRASVKGLPATLTLYQWLWKLDRSSGMCWFCHENRADVIEHLQPIAEKGGTTDENCFPACIACNSSKGPKYPDPNSGN